MRVIKLFLTFILIYKNWLVWSIFKRRVNDKLGVVYYFADSYLSFLLYV